ncbi:MAG: GNAT family N-acetyltransferase [Candidatus Aenigmarchaeota archaeon]|nr:GNAT family N-acetyltransferase [Candidatus Aenigmarchaeota archaeon]
MMKMHAGQVVDRFRVGGDDVTLRLPRRADVQDLRFFINALVDEGERILLQGRVSLVEERRWLDRHFKSMREGTELCLCIDIGGRVVGTISIRREYTPPTASDHVATLGFGLLRPYRRRGIMAAAIPRALAFGQQAWGLEIITSSYAADNEASSRLHRRLGFRAHGKVPGGMRYRGRYIDHILVHRQVRRKK